MGAVHGCSLKYVALGGIYGLSAVTSPFSSPSLEENEIDSHPHPARIDFATALLLYSSFINFLIALLFHFQVGTDLLGKTTDGKIPLWSYIIFAPFHIPTIIYTKIHTDYGISHGVPVASEVADGWYIGGRYGDQLNLTWGGILDLTAEFPESCKSRNYLNIKCWDGTPPSPADIDRAATFGAMARKEGNVMVHCAHGRGRSTCCMVACLVKAGVYKNVEEAFKGCKPHRPVIKLNGRMKRALEEWENKYVK